MRAPQRHYGSSYPPRNLQPPPNEGTAKNNAAAFWLVNAFNEATAAIPDWPDYPTLGTVGWRREKITDDEYNASPIAKEVRVGMKIWVLQQMLRIAFGRQAFEYMKFRLLIHI